MGREQGLSVAICSSARIAALFRYGVGFGVHYRIKLGKHCKLDEVDFTEALKPLGQLHPGYRRVLGYSGS